MSSFKVVEPDAVRFSLHMTFTTDGVKPPDSSVGI